ncbi:MAG: phytoene/squalene synthase family protein [Alphaproteobacteria bacterium]|nr:phytoene/squalene synthase family protein [Alphaproteobacteria bacterium]
MPVSPPDQGAADLAACRAMLRHGSRSFYAASLLLPRRVRDRATALYAFCRLADDTADDHGAAAGGRREALTRLRQRLDSIYLARPAKFAADRALARVVHDLGVPQLLFEALIDGLEWDLDGRRYDDLDDLLPYAVRVAGAVGAMMALVMQARDPRALACACDLGIAMQLTNIARDVGEDARAGRLYLPRQWLAAEGIDAEEFLRRPVFDVRVARVVRRLLDVADEFYRLAEPGIALLPLACQPGIRSARSIYAAIGHEIARNGHDSVSRRAVVSTRRKLVLLARAFAGTASAWPNKAVAQTLNDTTPAARFLVAAASSDPEMAPPAPPRLRPGRLIWLLDLFERLERAERAQREASEDLASLWAGGDLVR